MGGFCYLCGANGGTALELAHVVPVHRPMGPRGWAVGRSDNQLRDARRNPFGFLLLCRPCHAEMDGPGWRRPT
jgi:hypothetical protein